MRATFSQLGPAQAGAPIKGTFFPDAATANPSVPAILPRVLAVLAGVVFMRTLARVARHHGGHGTGRERRMERLAQLHRDLHAREDSAAKDSQGVAA
jgi:hypothetical protein